METVFRKWHGGGRRSLGADRKWAPRWSGVYCVVGGVRAISGSNQKSKQKTIDVAHEELKTGNFSKKKLSHAVTAVCLCSRRTPAHPRLRNSITLSSLILMFWVFRRRSYWRAKGWHAAVTPLAAEPLRFGGFDDVNARERERGKKRERKTLSLILNLHIFVVWWLQCYSPANGVIRCTRYKQWWLRLNSVEKGQVHYGSDALGITGSEG